MWGHAGGIRAAWTRAMLKYTENNGSYRPGRGSLGVHLGQLQNQDMFSVVTPTGHVSTSNLLEPALQLRRNAGAEGRHTPVFGVHLQLALGHRSVSPRKGSHK